MSDYEGKNGIKRNVFGHKTIFGVQTVIGVKNYTDRKNYIKGVMIMRKVVLGLAAIIVLMGIVFAGAPVKSSAAAKLSAPKITNKTSTSDAVTIEWTKVEDADGYIIYKYSSKAKKYKSCGTVSSASVTVYEITGLKSEKTYKFKVAAYVLKSGKKSAQKNQRLSRSKRSQRKRNLLILPRTISMHMMRKTIP